MQAIIGHSQKNSELDRKLKQKELSALQARDEELDGLFERIYEDNELIEKIEVHQAEKIDGVWEQRLTIHYNCVGTIFIPKPCRCPPRRCP